MRHSARSGLYVVRIIYGKAPLIYAKVSPTRCSPLRHVLMQRRRTMKRALIGILSTGIFPLSLGLESANAQMYGPSGDSRAYNSRAYAAQPRNTVRRGAARNAPLYNNSDS